MAVELKKGQKVSLEKKSNNLGEIVVNLNWNQGEPKKKGFLQSIFGSKNVDLDLACLFELKDGRKSAIQALGNQFGNLKEEPYIALDGDDRTGEQTGGENLRINGNMVAKIKRILIFSFIYEGVANWKQVDGIVTVKYPGNEDIIVRMDEYATTERLCAIALFENVEDRTFSVEKNIQFFRSQTDMDKAYNWGLKWTPGRK